MGQFKEIYKAISPFKWFWAWVFAFSGFPVSYPGIQEFLSSGLELPDMNIGMYYFVVGFLVIVVLLVRLIQIQVPRFKLSLHFIGDVVPMKNVKNTSQKLFDSKYVHIRVDSISGSSVEGCTAHLISILKLGNDGKFSKTEFKESYPLPWSHGHGAKPKTLIPNVESYIDVVQTISTKNKLVLVKTMPSKIENTFDDHTTYRLEIVVYGGEVSKSITIDVDWKGQWDTISARPASNVTR